MKQFFSISLLCTTLLAIAGGEQSKMSHQQKKTKESRSLELSEPSPFDGNKWDIVFLGKDNTVYACSNQTDFNSSKDNVVREWSFDGKTKNREVTFSSNRPALYSFNEGNIAIFDYTSFKIINPSGSHATFRVGKIIKTIGVTDSGQAMVLTTDGTVARCDATARATEGSQTIDMEDTSCFFPFSNGGIAYFQGCKFCAGRKKLCILDFDPKERLKQIVLREKLRSVCDQKIADKYLLAAHDTSHTSNQAELVLYDIEQNSEYFRFPTGSHPKLFSVSPNSTKVATGGDGYKGSRINLCDIETGTQLYSGEADGISGQCGLRLDDNDQIYFVGAQPFPTSQIIDTREASKRE